MTRWLALLAASLSLVTFGTAEAAYPDKPVRIIVPFIAGSAPDVAARQVAQRLTASLGQQFVVDNKPGVAGNIGAEVAARAAPDGYSLMLMTSSHILSPLLYAKVNFDPIKDFVPVTLVTRFPLVMVINPNVPAKNLAEFIALAKAEPGKRTFGSSGVGGSSHLPAEMFTRRAGVQMTHVPFRGNAPSSAALLGGQIDMIVDGLAPQLGNIAEGRVRVLGVTTAERTPFLPDAPAVSEVLPGYQFPMWVALFAPARTPKAIVDRLAAEVGKAMQDPATRKRYADVKVDAVGSTPEEFDKFFREQLRFNEDIIKSANIQQE